MRETIEEYIARGGEIEYIKPGSKTTMTNSELIKHDRVLKNMKLLLEREGLSEEDKFTVESAISRRIELLR
ncbi:MAG: hypothetical protein ACXABY_18525 [Candidatus Thorarchaeota archaeon]|jgi:hypothetical protein